MKRKKQKQPQIQGQADHTASASVPTRSAPPLRLPVIPSREHSSLPPNPNRKWALACLWVIIVLAAAALQWSDGNFLARNLIDYDDFEIIRPMLKLDWHGYWNDWLPERTNYAFPLRDLTHFFDLRLALLTGMNPGTDSNIGVAWVTQFTLFAGALAFHLAVFSRVLSGRLLWIALPFAVYALHPLQTETLQWLTCRKYVVPGLFIAAGALLFVRWRSQPLTWQRLGTLMLLWVAALLGYPTAALWMFWLFFALWLWGHPIRQLAPWAVASTVICIAYLAYVGSGTGEVNAGLTSVLNNSGKAWFFGTNALGRGFWNLLFPYWLAPYYNELSWRNTAGLATLGLAGLALVVKVLKNHPQNSGNVREGITWISLALVLLIPTANTILTFHDFMLADRHLYLSLPYLVLGGAVLLRSAVKQKTQDPNHPTPIVSAPAAIALALAAVWLGFGAKTVTEYVPLWRNSYTLMEACALGEASPRCHSQAIRRLFFKDKCNLTSHIIESSAQVYKKTPPPWALEFRTEVPFFHASCLALAAKRSTDEKIQQIDNLSEFYGESADIIFGLVLANLEKGDLKAALALAGQYYMGPLDKGPIFVTNSLLGAYRGQIEGLCRLDPFGSCPTALKRFNELHPATANFIGSVNWGRAATEMMARRGGLL